MGQASSGKGSAVQRRLSPGERFRLLRLACGLTLRDVEQASLNLSTQLKNRDFWLPASRLHHIETRGVVPSIHRLYTLASIYRHDMAEFFHWYGVPQQNGSKPAVTSYSTAVSAGR